METIQVGEEVLSRSEFDPAAEGTAKPFCSARCRTIDLGRWLGESYSLPEARPAAGILEEGEDDVQ